jgi:hypothetical protein
MSNWRWIYKRNDLINRIKNYQDSHPEDNEIADFLLEIIYLFNNLEVGIS